MSGSDLAAFLISIVGLGLAAWVFGMLWAARPPAPRRRPPAPPLSPIELYVAGGGDLSTAPAGVIALPAEAEAGWNRRIASDGEGS